MLKRAALMMPLAAVRGSGASDWRDDVIEHRKDEDHRKVRSILKQVEQAFIKPLTDYAFPVTVLPQSTELEAVCTIFETLNRTGKPLTPFELISARAFAGGHSLRDLWDAALEAHPILADFDVDPYYVLQVIALRLGAWCPQPGSSAPRSHRHRSRMGRRLCRHRGGRTAAAG